MGEQERIDLVAAYHRRAGIDLRKEKLHAIIHTAVENQIAEGDRLPVGRVVRRLMSEGHDRHDAIHAIGSVLIMHMHDRMTAADADNRPGAVASDEDPNTRYFAELERLTADGWLRSFDPDG
jgi:hypothetical protein